jgi:hypothetical protein
MVSALQAYAHAEYGRDRGCVDRGGWRMSDEAMAIHQETDKRFGIAITAIQDLLKAIQFERGIAEAKIKEFENLLNIQKKAEGDNKHAKTK